MNDAEILVLRVAIAVIFWIHGTGKLPIWHTSPLEPTTSSMRFFMKLLSIVEPLGSIALFVGFLTSAAAAGFAIIMLGAIWIKYKVLHTPFMAKQKTGWELDFLILVGCTALMSSGGGFFSLDRVLFGM